MTTLQWPATLRELDLFAECSDDELRRAGALMTPTEIPPGEAFIQEGHLGREAVIIDDGLAQVTMAGQEVAAVGRIGQSGGTVAELRIDVHALVEQLLDGRSVSLAGRFRQPA